MDSIKYWRGLPGLGGGRHGQNYAMAEQNFCKDNFIKVMIDEQNQRLRKKVMSLRNKYFP